MRARQSHSASARPNCHRRQGEINRGAFLGGEKVGARYIGGRFLGRRLAPVQRFESGLCRAGVPGTIPAMWEAWDGPLPCVARNSNDMISQSLLISQL